MTVRKMSPAPSRKRRILKWLLWGFMGLITLLGCLIALLIWSPRSRDWAMTRLLTEPTISDRLAGIPVRTKSQPVRLAKVRMRDGVELSTQVYLPEGKGPWPVIVVRDPYSFVQYTSCKVFVRYGYACVYQEVRGRGASPGTWYPFVNERRDGLDLIAWILKQPWQNGRLALQGGSYLGVTAWAPTGDMPPEVKTIVPTVAHGDVYQLAYHNGMFNQGVGGVWLYSQFQPVYRMLWAESSWQDKVAGHFPALGVDPTGFRAAWTPYKDYLSHPDRDDPYWMSPEYVALRQAHKKIKVPVLMLGYANDFFLPGMLRTYEELPTREQSVLVIGPGNHGGRPDPEIEGTYSQDYADTIAWFDHYLRGGPLPGRLRAGINVFVHGDNAWRRYSNWPQDAKAVLFHLGKLASAHGCDGGTLLPQAPSAEPPAHYVYDPRNPVPTRGGPFMLLSEAVAEQGNDLCARGDVLSFASPPLDRNMLLSGRIRVRLQVASDAADTAFTAKLSEHFADGRVYNIRDDISTLSMRNGAMHRIHYAPGTRVEVIFDMTPILWKLHNGSRLRLDISSSSGPAFFPHPNRAGLWSAIGNPKVAHQSIFGGDLELQIE